MSNKPLNRFCKLENRHFTIENVLSKRSSADELDSSTQALRKEKSVFCHFMLSIASKQKQEWEKKCFCTRNIFFTVRLSFTAFRRLQCKNSETVFDYLRNVLLLGNFIISLVTINKIKLVVSHQIIISVYINHISGKNI